MIKRYTRKEIGAIWEDYNRYSIWLSIELAAAEAMEKFKIIPKGVVKKVRSKARINPNRISIIIFPNIFDFFSSISFNHKFLVSLINLSKNFTAIFSYTYCMFKLCR